MDYCKTLTLAGKDDWRLPAKEELETLLDKRYKPTIAPEFPNTPEALFWTSTQSGYGNTMGVHFGFGILKETNTGWGGSFFARYVRKD